MTFRLTLATPDKVYFEGLVTAAVCPGQEGSFGLLTGHAPLVAGLMTGILKLETEEGPRFFVIDSGLAEVDQQHADVLVANVVPADNATQAYEKLEELKIAIYKRSHL
jgi:F-type H+-transporting ATPase subunit epsilon